MDWEVQLSCPINGGLYPCGVGWGGDEADHGSLFCKEMCHVDHGNGVALGHEWHRNKVRLWSFIFACHGCLTVWSSLKCRDGEGTAAYELMHITVLIKGVLLAHK